MKAYSRTIGHDQRPVAIAKTSTQGAAVGITTDAGHKFQLAGYRRLEEDKPDEIHFQIFGQDEQMILDLLQPSPDQKPLVTISGQAAELAEHLIRRIKELDPGNQEAIAMAEAAKKSLLDANINLQGLYNQSKGQRGQEQA